jgi:hypothetical protein
MICVKGMEIIIRGKLITEIGPELVALVGAIHDAAAPKMGGGAAADFIDICIKSALQRDIPEEG